MSYCRFENTYHDLKDCEGALDNGEKLSASEAKYALQLIRLCGAIADEHEDLELRHITDPEELEND